MCTLQVPGVWVQALAFSPDGSTLAACGAFENIVHLWDLMAVQKATTSDFFASYFHETPVLDPRAGQNVTTLDMKNDQVRAIAFSSDGHLAAIGLKRFESKGFVRLVDARNWKVVRTLEGHSGSLISKLAFSRDAKKLVSGSTDVKVWDVDTGRALHSFKGGIRKLGSGLLF
jgi:WD40 repeat protein